MQTVSRREFLKMLGIIAVGILCAPLEKWLFLGKKKPTAGLKEAKYYRRTDVLAG